MSALSTYCEYELTQTVTFDPWAVRDETASRHNVLARQRAAAQRKIAKLTTEMARLEALHTAALAQIRIEQEG